MTMTFRDSFEERLLTALLADHPANHTSATSPPVERRRRSPRSPRMVMLVGATAAAILLVAATVWAPGGGRGVAAAATPTPLVLSAPTDATEVLDRLAAIARAADEPATAENWYQHRNEWFLTTAVSDDDVTSWVTPRVVEVWSTPDGLRRVTSSGVPIDPSNTSAEDEAAAVAALPTAPGDEELFPPDGLRDQPAIDSSEAFRAEALAAYPQQLPSDVLWREVVAYLAGGHVTPAQTALLLEVVAEINEVEHRGLVIDRAGRSVHAITYEPRSGLDTREALLFDPKTAQFLGYEEVLIGDPMSLNVTPPAVIAYVVVLTSRNL